MGVPGWTLAAARHLAWTMGLFGAIGVEAHHSYAEFDGTQTVEIEGTLVALAWQNPHTRMEVRVLDSSKAVIVWDIETGSVNSMRRQGAPLDAFKVGEVVKIAGWPSKRTVDRLYATNVLGSGHELMFQTATPRWPGAATYREGFTSAPTAPAAGSTPTLFRVWVSDPRVDPDTRPGFLSRVQVSLTPAAQQAVAAFDPVTQSAAAGCNPKGMPLLMGQPFPIEFVKQGDVILLRLEEYDAVRTIHTAAAPPPASLPHSVLGYSVGRWERNTLVVETDRIDTPYFNSAGVPLSRAAHTLERFTVSDDGRRLSYTLSVTDPETFTEPVRANRAWLARDGEQLLPFDCKAPRF